MECSSPQGLWESRDLHEYVNAVFRCVQHGYYECGYQFIVTPCVVRCTSIGRCTSMPSNIRHCDVCVSVVAAPVP